MWYKIKAKDLAINRTYKFSLWAKSETELMKILKSKKMVDIKILGETENWTPEWADSFSDDSLNRRT